MDRAEFRAHRWFARDWLADAFEQFGGSDLQASGYLHDVEQAEITLAALDAPDIGPVQPGLLGEAFLGPAALLA